ncbi:chemotaxis protein CheW [Vibrio lamellibrachiae]|uniref:chemotaxis protein CheW n=1 Tax=Vibrio lamellibrachiae TaxID=2910253 RepID=UPI003D09B597
MSNHTLISSEQALDEYFTALLDEEEMQLSEESVAENIEPPVELEPELEAQVEVAEKSFYKVHSDEIVAPNLEDVERLLQQMEASNPVAELDLEEVLDQNTLQIAADKKAQEEEIQEWPVDDMAIEEVQVEETVIEVLAVDEPVVQEFEIVEPQVEIDTAVELETQTGGSQVDVWHSTERVQDFQVLYFDVNGVMFAVPLDELGGIHRLGELSNLIGRPNWYLGLQTSKENQLDVVDTAQWVMSEKLTDDSHKEQYQYIVMMGESMWGLAGTELKGTESLSADKVRWRKTAGKRPWLAGMVKEKMCALIHVEALIAMLNAGLDVKALNK